MTHRTESRPKRVTSTKKKSTSRKPGRGRPTAYKKEYADLVYQLALGGLTNEEMARCFDVSSTTLDNWRRKHPEFLVAMRRGKLEADARVAHSLFNRAIGMTTEELRETVAKDGKVVALKSVKQIPGDVTAMKYWLSNRQPDKWRDRIETKSETPGIFQIRINEFMKPDPHRED